MAVSRKLGVLLAMLFGLFALSVVLPIDAWALVFAARVRDAGVLGAVIYALAYTPGAVLLVPAAAFSLGAGFAFGVPLGVAVAIPGAALSSIVVFVLGRTVLQGAVQDRLAAYPKFRAIERAVEKHGIKTVVLLRLSPIMPFNLLNYLFGVTRLTLGQYVVASFVGVVPGAVLFAYIGSLVTSAAEYAQGVRPEAGPGEAALYWFGLFATLLVVVVVGRVARRELRSTLET
jgi:uncharacterized membrane protein YdjX (TVP38/TMEM64 family)